MSDWTYLSSVIEVEPLGQTNEEKRYILETVLNHLPLVTGSEGDMEVYINRRRRSDCTCSCDEYGNRTNNLVDDYGGHSRKHGFLHIQDVYFITVEGAFRDRVFDQTYREFVKWLCRLAKRIIVDSVLVKIEGWQRHVILYYNDLNDMFVWPSWCTGRNTEVKVNWCEHLLRGGKSPYKN